MQLNKADLARCPLTQFVTPLRSVLYLNIWLDIALIDYSIHCSRLSTRQLPFPAFTVPIPHMFWLSAHDLTSRVIRPAAEGLKY